MRNIRYINRNGPYVRFTDVAIAIGARDGSMLARREINRKNLIHLEQETDKPTDNIKHSRIFGNETVIRELANKSKQLPRRRHLARLAGIMQAMKSEGQQVGSIVFDKEGFKFVAGAGQPELSLPPADTAASLIPPAVSTMKHLINELAAPAKTKPQPAVDAAEEARQRFLRDSALVSPPAVARMAGMILSEVCSELGGETPPTTAVVKEAIPVETVVTGGKTPPVAADKLKREEDRADRLLRVLATAEKGVAWVERMFAEQYVGRMLATLPELNLWPQAGNYEVIKESFDWLVLDPTHNLWATTVAVTIPGKKNVRYLAGVRFSPGPQPREIVNGYLKEWPLGMKSVEFPDFPADVQHVFRRILKQPEVVDYGRSSLNPPVNRQQMADQYVGGLLAAIPELKGSDYRPTRQSFDWSTQGDLLAMTLKLTAEGKKDVRYLAGVRFSPGSLSIVNGYVKEWSGQEFPDLSCLPADVRTLFYAVVDDLNRVPVNESVPRTEPPPSDDAEKIELYQEIALARREVLPGMQEPVIPNRDVARALGVDESTLRQHKSRHPELIQERAHYVTLPVTASHGGGTRDTLCWTKDGITVLVAGLVQTDQARKFLWKLLAAGKLAEAALKDDLQALKDDMRALSQQLLKERTPVPPPPPPSTIDIQATIEKEVAEKTKLIEAHVESQAAAKVQLAIAAMRDDLSPSLEQSKLGRPDFLAESGTPDKRTINYRGDFSGDSVPEYCRHWAWPEKMVHNPNTDKRFAFPPGLARLAGNGRPDGDFILLWMAEHMLVYRLTTLNQEALEKLGHRRDWLWYPTELLNGLHEAGKKYWYKWDAVVSRVEPPAAGLPKEEIRGPKWRFSPVLVTHLSAIWEDDRQNGNLLALAAKIRPSWFTGSKCKHYLERLKIGTREELLKLVGETEADAKAGDHADHT